MNSNKQEFDKFVQQHAAVWRNWKKDYDSERTTRIKNDEYEEEKYYMLSKELFVRGINLVKWGLEAEDKLCSCLEMLNHEQGRCEAFIYLQHNAMIIEILAHAMGEGTNMRTVGYIKDMLEWWIYETNFGTEENMITVCNHNHVNPEVEGCNGCGLCEWAKVGPDTWTLDSADILYDYLTEVYDLAKRPAEAKATAEIEITNK